jgi:hypothetical protein
MTKKQSVFITTFIVLAGLSLASYLYFLNYQPKAIKQLSEVKGYQTTNVNKLNLPYPNNAENIVVNDTEDTQQITFKSAKTKEEILKYYKNIMLSRKWIVDSEAIYSDFTIARYKQNDYLVKIIAYDEPEKTGTLTSIEILKNQ